MIVLLAALSLNLAPGEWTRSMAIGPGGCSSTLAYAKDPSIARLQKLGELSDARMELAVARINNATGCPAPLIVRYNVSR